MVLRVALKLAIEVSYCATMCVAFHSTHKVLSVNSTQMICLVGLNSQAKKSRIYSQSCNIYNGNVPIQKDCRHFAVVYDARCGLLMDIRKHIYIYIFNQQR
jgi:hypothetical protein